MFDIGASELLVIVVVAIIAIGPKDMPMALRSAGRWIGKMRRMSNHFRAGIDNMIREAEMEEAEKEWRERNARIMAEHPDAADKVRDPENLLTGAQMQPLAAPMAPREEEQGSSAESALARESQTPAPTSSADEPELPLDPAAKPPRGEE